MTNFEKAVEIATSVAREEGFTKLFKLHARSAIEQAIFTGWNFNDIFWDDDLNITDSDGSLKTYRQLSNAIRKNLKA